MEVRFEETWGDKGLTIFGSLFLKRGLWMVCNLGLIGRGRVPSPGRHKVRNFPRNCEADPETSVAAVC
jgi:hypothetical protein